MYTYSPIDTILVKNFRNIGDAEISFAESPIISLIGENESGKTSVVKAFGVCALHADPRSQKDYIRDGSVGFGVAIKLADGTLITRLKTTTSNRYTVKKPDGTIWDADKLENDCPKEVSLAMGLIQEPETKEFLQIRTYEDQLLFVVTPASTNYKVMYDALKIGQITKAIKLGNTQANELKAKINECDTSVITLQQSLSSIKTFDIEPLLNIRNRLSVESQLLAKIDSCLSLAQKIENLHGKLGALEELSRSNIQPIDETLVASVNDIGRLLDSIDTLKTKMSAYDELANTEEIDVNQFMKICEADDKRVAISELTETSKSYLSLSELSPISIEQIQKIETAFGVANDLTLKHRLSEIYQGVPSEDIGDSELRSISKIDRALELMSNNESATKSLKGMDEYIEQVINWMKSVGVAATSCPKCGESIILDLDLISNP